MPDELPQPPHRVTVKLAGGRRYSIEVRAFALPDQEKRAEVVEMPMPKPVPQANLKFHPHAFALVWPALGEPPEEKAVEMPKRDEDGQ